MDWGRIKELFGCAIELDPKERGAYLRGACGPDEALRAELESLLASYEAQKTTPARPIADHGYDGRRIGPYQVIDRIGAGGMGAVYLAARADDSFDKRVAIKVVHSASGTEEILQRFRYERQILATLDHPNIAKLLDGGVTEDGYRTSSWIISKAFRSANIARRKPSPSRSASPCFARCAPLCSMSIRTWLSIAI